MVSKMTDNEIKKALECCCENNICPSVCPLKDMAYVGDCYQVRSKYALDLINRLQAENERLQNILICFMDALGKVRKVDDIDEISLIPLMSELNKQYRAELKAEAYKEFAERLKELPYIPNRLNLHKAYDNLLKEMVGK